MSVTRHLDDLGVRIGAGGAVPIPTQSVRAAGHAERRENARTDGLSQPGKFEVGPAAWAAQRDEAGFQSLASRPDPVHGHKIGAGDADDFCIGGGADEAAHAPPGGHRQKPAEGGHGFRLPGCRLLGYAR